MCDGEEGDAAVLGCLVDAGLGINAHRTGALVQESKPGPAGVQYWLTLGRGSTLQVRTCTFTWGLQLK